MMDKVGKCDFLAEPFHCDFNHRLFVGHLCNSMLNAADFHSQDRGFGVAYLNSINKTWVLSRFAIEMEEMPMEYDKFTIETWLEGAMKLFTHRNFRISNKETGKVYGYGRSVWAMIDTETRQPTDVFSVRNGEINNWIETEKECPIVQPSRVKMSQNAELQKTISTVYSDIDINGHVNSIQYILHVLDLWSVNWYHEHRIHRFEIAYVAETHFGDTMSFYMEQTDKEEYCVRILKNEETEVVRCKVVFSATT